MFNYIIEIMYDGSNFNGYATQLHKNTVQDNLEKALKQIFKTSIRVHGSSRTDSKVHALSQFIIFQAPFFIDPIRLALALNINTDKALYIKECKINETNLHPRYDCISKTYKYVIRKSYNPFQINYSYYNQGKLNVKK